VRRVGIGSEMRRAGALGGRFAPELKHLENAGRMVRARPTGAVRSAAAKRTPGQPDPGPEQTVGPGARPNTYPRHMKQKYNSFGSPNQATIIK